MNEDSFLRCVEKNRDCEEARLDAAVNRGLLKAKSNRLDSRKFMLLAAACVFTAVLCFTVSLDPFESIVKSYHHSWNVKVPGGAEALDGYAKDIAVNFKSYLGGE